VASPTTVAGVASVLAIAGRLGIAVTPVGGASGIVGGFRTGARPIALDMRGFAEIELDPVSSVAWVGAGVVVQQLEDELHGHGFTCGHYPQSMRMATVGGMVATNGAGTFSTRYGRMRDMVEGLEVVLADGRQVTTQLGPDASTGPDLNHLFVGSEGTLGVITRALVRVWPSPARRAMTAYALPSVDRGLAALREIVGQGVYPALVRLYDEVEAEALWTGAGMEPGGCLLLLGQDGREDICALDMQICDLLLISHGARAVGDAPARHWYQHRFDWKRIPATNERVGGIADAIEVSASWRHLPDVWRATTAAVAPLCAQVESHLSHIYHTGGSVYIIFHAHAASDADAVALYDEILDRLLSASLAAGGNVSHHHGVGTAKARWLREQLGVGMSVLEDVKRALDPAGILSPGVLGLGGAGLEPGEGDREDAMSDGEITVPSVAGEPR
jgi:alkyldihydroxyacetonephosphate synthase